MKRKMMAVVLAHMLLFGTVTMSGMPVPVPQAHAVGDAQNAEANSGTDKEDVLDALFGGKKDDPKGDAQSGRQADGKPGREEVVRQVVEADYFDVLRQWEQEGVRPAAGFEQEVLPSSFAVQGRPAPLEAASGSEGYDMPAFRWDEQTPSVSFHVHVPQDGLYRMKIDYYPLTSKVISIERGLQIGGQYPYFQARQFKLAKYWKNGVYPFAKDLLGNDVLPDQEMIPGWRTQEVSDPASADDRALLFRLRAGDNEITLPYVSEPILLGRIVIASPETVPTYAEYSRMIGSDPAPSAIETIEAENIEMKNEPFIRAQADGDPSAVPFSSGSMRLNALGGDSWQVSGQDVTWKFQVPKDGNYRIALKYKQIEIKSDTGTDMPVYRSLRLDGALPFEEMRQVSFPYEKSWTNRVLADEKGEPYLYRLTAGEHTLTLMANDVPYRETILAVKDVMKGVNEFIIQLKMATGNTQDANRDWDLTDQIPDAAARLEQYAGKLEAQTERLTQRIGTTTDASKSMKISAQILRELAKDPNAIPYKSSRLNGGSGSVMQLLGKTLAKLPNQPLTLDRLYVYADKKLPSAHAGFFSRMKANASVFFGSFTKDYAKINDNGGDALQIWVNRPRQYVMAMQQLANEEFTKQTGIKVSFSLMPDETKLILANAAGNSPDAALSINTTTPFNLASRNTLTDLSRFPDYAEIAKRFAPGTMLPYQFNGGSYALPETQDFWVLFYRKDILDALNLPVPDTMEDVKRILPDLQRYGLNFFDPLALTGGNKQIWLTSPFIYQHGGELFTPDGGKTAIDSESAIAGIKEMTDLFTVYNLPLNVPVFYNHFRDGSLPIGISNFTTYIQLMSAAPEISGLWKIAPMPGVKNEAGTVERWAAGTAQTSIIFKNSKRQQDAWELLKWWTSAETQIQFGNRMQTIYGPTFMWNTANLEAFEQMAWPAEHIKVVQQQWRWLKDVPHVPGDYMLERQLSDAWNKIVFNGVNPRRAIEDATILTNRELAKKLQEFGFMKDGAWIKPLQMPTLSGGERQGSQP
ncbi:extracellular solute-binding protein [Cohnella nanjingensis]|uniref:Extracellular solute-binding protein n=1 Tax=Cohnella nanjingensis TaxID=1387779 RepID=A0A7X0RRK7_9BACL|nr:extracellular solute-binding protein [Cohnella nanjingensis]MBB6672178.1 extracellular solute-binding protein [Cohnella nanjingensis]